MEPKRKLFARNGEGNVEYEEHGRSKVGVELCQRAEVLELYV